MPVRRNHHDGRFFCPLDQGEDIVTCDQRKISGQNQNRTRSVYLRHYCCAFERCIQLRLTVLLNRARAKIARNGQGVRVTAHNQYAVHFLHFGKGFQCML